MSPMRCLRSLALFVAPVLLASLASSAHADGCSWRNLWGLCCPAPKATVTRTPHFHYKCVCPKPACDLCSLEHYGYYPTCWHPWPFPPDYSHCNDGLCAAPPIAAATLGTPTPAQVGPSPIGPMPPADQLILPEPRKGTEGEELPRPRP
jgi:hypothetical protein